jgi:S-formylglutathione hydrolase FrmB
LRSPETYLGLFSQYTADAEAVWGDPAGDRAAWAGHDPTELAGRLRGKRLFVSAGDGRPGPLDPPGATHDRLETLLLPESVAFVSRLARLGIPVRARLYGRGTHTWPYAERELHHALPLLLGTLR